jgi:hypothetical protein
MKTPFDADSVRIKDKYVVSLLESLTKKDSFKIDESMNIEIEALLKAVNLIKGKVRRIPYGDNGPDDLRIVGRLHSLVQSKKTRVREIDIRFLSLSASLVELKKRVTTYLNKQYALPLSSLKPLAVREAFFDSVLQEVNELLDKSKLMRDKATIVLDNLTDAYWSLSKIQEIAIEFMPPVDMIKNSGRQNI